ncbi:MAG: sugar phosphate isomerase/epimerase [Clostridia bacterium]|nr:sugar phosphate isomerase/epimerase [Clostridia bacterium]
MKIGLEALAYFTVHDYKDGLRKMKSHGYDCVDYSEICNPNCEPFGWSDAEYEKYLREVGEEAQQVGVEITQIHGLWPTDDRFCKQREKDLRLFEKQIRGAYYLGCKKMVVHPVMPYGWGSELDKDKVWELNIERYKRLTQYAEKYDVTVCTENMPFTAYDTSRTKALKELIKEIDHPLFKMCLDTGHANVCREDIAEDVRLLGDDLVALHVHDNKGNWDQHLIPYQGNIKWEEFLAALKEIGYKGCFTLETCVSRNTPEPVREEMRLSLAHLARSMADKCE